MLFRSVSQSRYYKKFQSHYADVPEVAAYTSLNKAKKLRDAFVKSFLNKMKEDPDLQKDGRIRPSFGYAPVVTHRTCARDPNLQQVPARGKLGKLIKRLFVARRGTLYIKVDYRVHEVRGWGLIAGDSAVAKVFLAAKALRDAYRLHPTSELARRVDTEADIHRANAVYFFNKTIDEVIKNKELRDAVKGVIYWKWLW